MTKSHPAMDRVGASSNDQVIALDAAEVSQLLSEYDLEIEEMQQGDFQKWAARRSKRSRREHNLLMPALGGILMAGIMALGFLNIIGR